MSDDPAREEPYLTASKLLMWRSERSGVAFPRLPEAAVLTHQGSLLPKRRPWSRGRTAPPFSFATHPIAGGAGVLALVRGVGAPATAIAIEELAACGVRRLIAVDVGGSLDASVRSSDAVLVDAALARDGTSPHYTSRLPYPAEAPKALPAPLSVERRGAGGEVTFANEGLTQRLADRLTASGLAFSRGRVWSTDAVYRELPSDVEAARRDGALVADMETAAVFAVAAFLDIEAAAVLVAADALHDGWHPPTGMDAVNASLRAVFDAATACLLP